MCMEGIEQNPIVYELMSEMSFRRESVLVLVICYCVISTHFHVSTISFFTCFCFCRSGLRLTLVDDMVKQLMRSKLLGIFFIGLSIIAQMELL